MIRLYRCRFRGDSKSLSRLLRNRRLRRVASLIRFCTSLSEVVTAKTKNDRHWVVFSLLRAGVLYLLLFRRRRFRECLARDKVALNFV